MTFRSEREEKFDNIYRAYESVVYKVARNYVNEDNAAYDISQETFYQFHERMDDISATGVKAYLVATARNLAINYKRDAKHEIQCDEMEEIASKKEIPTESLEEAYIRNEKRKVEIQFGAEIFKELREKNENWYEIMYMSLVQGMSYDEIAEKIQVPKEVLYSRIHRAREWIIKKYGDRFNNIEA